MSIILAIQIEEILTGLLEQFGLAGAVVFILLITLYFQSRSSARQVAAITKQVQVQADSQQTLNDAFEKQTSERAELVAKLDRQQSELSQAHQRIAESALTIVKLQNELNNQKERLDASVKLYESAQKQINDLQEALAETGTQVGLAEQRAETSEAEFKAEKKRADELAAANKTLTDEITTLKSKVETQEATIVRLEARVAHLEKENHSLKTNGAAIAEADTPKT